MRRITVVIAALLIAAGCSSSSKSSAKSTPATSAASSATTAPAARAGAGIGHVFVVELENKGFDETWGESSVAKYLNDQLVPKGQLLTNYFGIGHVSLGNYIAEISGQKPNPATSSDCTQYVEYANGTGCVYPASVKTVADQLTDAHKTWKTYQEDMSTPCRHPQIGTADPTVAARKGDMYATRHNPFVYFHSVIDTPACQTNVVDLKNLDADLASVATTPNFVFVTPNLCHDGHDSPCVDGEPGGLTSADAFLSTYAPKILSSPAFKADGMLIITLDEAEMGDTTNGGGHIGTLVISSKTKPATINDNKYDHYSLLCSIENVFGLAHLGEAAAPATKCFGSDVYNAGT